MPQLRQTPPITPGSERISQPIQEPFKYEDLMDYENKEFDVMGLEIGPHGLREYEFSYPPPGLFDLKEWEGKASTSFLNI